MNKALYNIVMARWFLEFMVGGLYKKLSPEVIRNELLNVQISILKDTKTGKR